MDTIPLPAENTVGFVGVGRMGANMARRLHERGFHLTALYDANTAAVAELAAELGVPHARALSEVSAAAAIVITVVSDDAAMRAIFDAGNADSLLAPAAAAGRLFINCATVSPAIHHAVQSLAELAGAQSLEACMASSITQAREGSLYLMCGGKPEAFARAQPVLQSLGSKVRLIGGAGEAAQVKALVNMVMNINTAGLAEGLGLGSALGLELTMLREVFSETGANSRVLATDGEDMQNRAHDCYFSAAHAAKDSGIALTLAENHHLALPLAAATKAQYDRMIELGLGGLDKSGIAELTFPGRLKQGAPTK
jgi:3-hydroxyisobutyrate dehydrogenase-like beta-hydroxyacid dehydrogenase